MCAISLPSHNVNFETEVEINNNEDAGLLNHTAKHISSHKFYVNGSSINNTVAQSQWSQRRAIFCNEPRIEFNHDSRSHAIYSLSFINWSMKMEYRQDLGVPFRASAKIGRCLMPDFYIVL